MGAVITGMGSVCALGRGTRALWSGIEAGRDGITEIGRFSTQGIKSKIAGMVPDRNSVADGQTSISSLNLEFALDAAQEAWSMAGLDRAGIAPERIALVLGTSLGDFKMPLHIMTEAVAAGLGLRGPILTVSTACSSSTNALGLGLDLLRQGFADAVVAGGSDVLNPIMLAGFNSLGVLSAGKCAPFSHPFGTTLGEGAGFLVLENAGAAERRGAKSHGVLVGYGLSGDAYHDTSPDPTGGGVARAISAALGHAALPAEKISYVNAHGTGTAANDPAEWQALLTVFGAHARGIPVSSSKSFLGHAQGASGVLEIIATLMSLRAQVVPPTLNFTTARKNSPADPVFSSGPRPHRCQYAVCTNSAFGGANAAVVIGVPGMNPNGLAARKKTVYVAGVGAMGAHGRDLEALLSAITEARPVHAGRVPDFSLSEILPTVDPHGLDPATRFLIAAVGLAMSDAGLKPKRTRSDRQGLVMGINRPSPESERILHQSIEKNGMPLLSTTAFSRMVLNAPAGSCSKLLSLGGPLSTISTGQGSGLAAMAYAADMLQNRDDADMLIAGGLDEFDSDGEAANTGEGAGCAVLATRPNAGDASIVVAGWGLAGAGRLGDAVRAAILSAHIGEDSVAALFGCGTEDVLPGRPRMDPGRALGYGSAFTTAVAFVAAAHWLRKGSAKNVLVADGYGQSATCAIILSRREENGN